MKRLILVVAIVILGMAFYQNLPQLKSKSWFSTAIDKAEDLTVPDQKQTVVYQESVVIKVVEDSLPSVVTISVSTTAQNLDPFADDPFSPFRRSLDEDRVIEQNIGSGFIVDANGLIITNKHVVLDTDFDYKVITNDKKEYTVEKIYRDPLNDLAILKINATRLKPLNLGDSSKLKLGQMAIAIGTPLGEFQNTITTGIVSGLGRGITAGSPFEGFVERLDDVIQTDAAISPGNSGGPLLNSAGQAIGVNTAVASEGQNLGFAIPINIVKNLLKSFEQQGGTFERPYIGIRYQNIDRATALRMDIVEGANIESVIEASPAEKAGLQEGDIVTLIDDNKVDGSDERGLAEAIMKKKIGETMMLTVWRDEETFPVELTLEGYSE